MTQFIKALYSDLLHRIEIVIAEINLKKHHPDIEKRFIASTIEEFQKIQVQLQQALEISALEFENLARNYLYRYNRAYREFNALYSYRFLALKHYSQPEIFFFRLISKIYLEHRINALPPIVSTISNHDYYYWAVPYFEIIALPSGEEHSLLNLPDMFHEIGHLLHSMFNAKSCELSLLEIEKHFIKTKTNLAHKGHLKHFDKQIQRARHLWQTSWMEEFTCDLVGTYMTGAAYAWTNLKLLSTGHGSSKIFDDSDSHPADEARMKIILLMLEKLNLKEEKTNIEGTWNFFLRDTEIFKSKEYPLIYPDRILQIIVDEFYEFYQNADLASYLEVVEKPDSIAEILNSAWIVAQNVDINYRIHESIVLEKLNHEFGLKSES